MTNPSDYSGVVYKYTIEHFINDLKKDSSKLFKFIYRTFYPAVRSYILRQKGNEQDVKDVFQDAILAIIRNVENNKLKGSDILFQTYLLSICRHIWYNQLRSPETDKLGESDLTDEYGIDEELMKSVDETTERQIYQSNFKKLDKICQKILKDHLKRVPDKKIAKKVNINISYLKKRKHLCKEKLIKMIKEDPKYLIYMKDKNI
jgi:RNA polymerase sigma factor (sigma-70 family)